MYQMAIGRKGYVKALVDNKISKGDGEGNF